MLRISENRLHIRKTRKCNSSRKGIIPFPTTDYKIFILKSQMKNFKRIVKGLVDYYKSTSDNYVPIYVDTILSSYVKVVRNYE